MFRYNSGLLLFKQTEESRTLIVIFHRVYVYLQKMIILKI